MNNIELEMERQMYEHDRKWKRFLRCTIGVHVVFIVLEVGGFIAFLFRTILPSGWWVLMSAGTGAMFVHAMLFNLKEIGKARRELRGE